MLRWFALLAGASVCLAQAPADSASAPPEVDRALRARITEFYQDYVDGKFRQAEALVAEDTKDFFYNTNKAKLLSFEIVRIEYSENLTRAKVTMLIEEYVLIPGFTDKPMKVPVPSTWKLVDGQWYWWVDLEALKQTPFGVAKVGPPGAPAPVSIPSAQEMNYIFTQLKVDKPAVTIKPGQSEQITVTNTAKGPMSLTLSGKPPGVDVKLGRKDLNAGEQTSITIQAGEDAKSGGFDIQVLPTSQVIQIKVTVR